MCGVMCFVALVHTAAIFLCYFVLLCTTNIRMSISLYFHFLEKIPEYREIFHSLDVWHKACKVTANVSEVCNTVQ